MRYADSRNRGSALIGILIAALIVAILWVARTKKSNQAEKSPEDVRPDIHSAAGINKTLDAARKAEKEQSDRVRELNKKMVEAEP